MKKEMTNKVSLLFLNYSMQMGGIETLIYEITGRLKNDKNFVPKIGVFKSGGSLEMRLRSEGVEVFDLNKKEGIDLSLIFRLRRLLRNNEIKVLHTHNYSAWFYGILASIGIKSLIHIHTEHSNVERKRRVWIENLLCRFTDKIVPVSGAVEAFMFDHGLKRDKLKLIYNGVDTKRFFKDPQKRKICRESLKIDSDTFVIGIVARLTPVKDHITLIRAFHSISRNIQNSKLLIVGDGILKDKLLEEVIRLGISDKVIFLGERKDIPELLNAMDLFVLSSISEGHNVSLIEAMSAELSIIATNVGGNSEVVVDNETGFLVPSGDHEAISTKAINLYKDNNLMKTMGFKSRERVMKYFAFDTMLSNYQNLYEEVFNKLG